jgi:hypothetical protein
MVLWTARARETTARSLPDMMVDMECVEGMDERGNKIRTELRKYSSRVSDHFIPLRLPAYAVEKPVV